MYLFMFAVQCVIPTYIFTSHVLICVFDFNACFALRAIFKHWFRAMTQMMCYSLCCCWMFLVSPDLGVSVGLTVSKWYRWIRIFCLTTVRNLHKSWIMVQWNKIRCLWKETPLGGADGSVSIEPLGRKAWWIPSFLRFLFPKTQLTMQCKYFRIFPGTRWSPKGRYICFFLNASFLYLLPWDSSPLYHHDLGRVLFSNHLKEI